MKKVVNIILSLILIFSIVPPSVLCQENSLLKLNNIPSEKVLYKDPEDRFLIVVLSDQERENLLSLIKSKLNEFNWLNKGPKFNTEFNAFATKPTIDKNNVENNPIIIDTIPLKNLEIMDPRNIPKSIDGIASVMFVNVGPIGFCYNSNNTTKTVCSSGFGKNSELLKNDSLKEKYIGDSYLLLNLIKSGFSKVEGNRIDIAQPNMGDNTYTFYLKEHFYKFIRDVVTSGLNSLADTIYVVVNVINLGQGVKDLGVAALNAAKNPKKFFKVFSDTKKYLSSETKAKNAIRDAITKSGYDISKFDEAVKLLKEGKLKDAKKAFLEFLRSQKIKNADLKPIIDSIKSPEDAKAMAKLFLEEAGDVKVLEIKFNANKILDKIDNFKNSLSSIIHTGSTTFRPNSYLNDLKKIVEEYRDNKISLKQFVEKYRSKYEDLWNSFESFKNYPDVDTSSIEYIEKLIKDLGLEKYIKTDEIKFKDSNWGKLLEKVENGEITGKNAVKVVKKVFEEINKGEYPVYGTFIEENGKLKLAKDFFGKDIKIGFASENPNVFDNIGDIAIESKKDDNLKLVFKFVDDQGKPIALKVDDVVLNKNDLEKIAESAKVYLEDVRRKIEELKNRGELNENNLKNFGKIIFEKIIDINDNIKVKFKYKPREDIDKIEKLNDEIKKLDERIKLLDEFLNSIRKKDNFKIVLKTKLDNDKRLLNGILENEFTKGVSTALVKMYGSKIANKIAKISPKVSELSRIIPKILSNAAKGIIVTTRPGFFVSSILLATNDLFGAYAGSLKAYGFSITMNSPENKTQFVAIMPTTILNNNGYFGGDAIKSFVEFVTGEKLGPVDNLIDKGITTVYSFFTPKEIKTDLESVKEEYKQMYIQLRKVFNNPYNLIVIHDAVSPNVKRKKAINIQKLEFNDKATFSYDDLRKVGTFTYITENHTVQITAFESPTALEKTNIVSISLFTRDITPLVYYSTQGTMLENLNPTYMESFTDYIIKANDQTLRLLPWLAITGGTVGAVAGPLSKKVSQIFTTTNIFNLLYKAAIVYLLGTVIYHNTKSAIENSVVFNNEKFLKEAGFEKYVGKDCKEVLKDNNIKILGYDTGLNGYTFFKYLKTAASIVGTASTAGALETGGLSLVVSLISLIVEWKASVAEQEFLKREYYGLLTCKERNNIFIINKKLSSEPTEALNKIKSFENNLRDYIYGNNSKEEQNKTINDLNDLNKLLPNNENIKNVEDQIAFAIPTTNAIVTPASREVYQYSAIMMIYLYNSSALNQLSQIKLNFSNNTSVIYNKDKMVVNGKTVAQIIPINILDQNDLAFAISNKIVLINKNYHDYIFEVDKYGNLNISLKNLKERVKNNILLGANKEYHVDTIRTKKFIIQYYNGRLIAEPLEDIEKIGDKIGIQKGKEIYVDSVKINSDGTVLIEYNGNQYLDSLENVFFDNNDGLISNDIYEGYLVFTTRYIVSFDKKDVTNVGTTGKELNNKPIISVNTNNKTTNEILDKFTEDGVDAIATNNTMITFNKDGTVNITDMINGITEQYKKVAVTKDGIILEKDGKYYLLKIYKDPDTDLINVSLVPLKSKNEKDAEKEASSLTDQDIKERAIFNQPMLYMWTPNGMMYQNPTTGEIKVMNDFAFPINPNFNLYGAVMNGQGVYPSPNPFGLTPGVDFNKNIKERPSLNVPSIPEGIPGLLFIIALFITISIIRGNKNEM